MDYDISPPSLDKQLEIIKQVYEEKRKVKTMFFHSLIGNRTVYEHKKWVIYSEEIPSKSGLDIRKIMETNISKLNELPFADNNQDLNFMKPCIICQKNQNETISLDLSNPSIFSYYCPFCNLLFEEYFSIYWDL